jgi:hypothetical protein
MFSLTRYLGKFTFSCVYGQQVFLDKFPLTCCCCSCAGNVVKHLSHVKAIFSLPKPYRSISSTLVKFSLSGQILDTNRFSSSKSWHDYLWNKAPWQGKVVNFLPYTRANKTCKEKIARLYEALRKGSVWHH